MMAIPDGRRSSRRLLGLILAVALGSSACSGPTSDSEAESAKAKKLATELHSKLEKAGLQVPSEAVTATLYGEDGGISCVNANELQQTLGQVTFGAPAIGRRVVIDPKVLAYDVAVVSTYCPDVLSQFRSDIADLKTESTIPS